MTETEATGVWARTLQVISHPFFILATMLVAFAGFSVAIYGLAQYNDKHDKAIAAICNLVTPIVAQQLSPDANSDAVAAHDQAVAIAAHLNCD